jgi:hypothetical protein
VLSGPETWAKVSEKSVPRTGNCRETHLPVDLVRNFRRKFKDWIGHCLNNRIYFGRNHRLSHVVWLQGIPALWPLPFSGPKASVSQFPEPRSGPAPTQEAQPPGARAVGRSLPPKTSGSSGGVAGWVHPSPSKMATARCPNWRGCIAASSFSN